MFGKQRDECGNARLFICGGGWARYFIYEYVNAGRNGDRFFRRTKYMICSPFRDKRLIPCFCRCDIFCNMPHSENTPSNRFSSKIPCK